MNNFIAKFLKPRTTYAKCLLVLLIAAFFALGFMGYIKPIETFLSAERFSFQVGDIRFSLYLLLKSSIVLIMLFWATGIVSGFGETRIKTIKGVNALNKTLITKVFQFSVYFAAVLIMLGVLGIDLTVLAVFGGAAGIGIGFGLQKIAANFISGLILLFEKSIENDDLVELSDGTYGFVRHIGARYTLVETFDGKEIMIPNENFIISPVTNWTFSDNKRRLHIPVGVSYRSDIEKARELILESAKEYTECIDDPEPVCYLREFGDSSVNFLLLFWIDNDTESGLRPRSEVMFSIWRKFKEHDIEIPFPQRDLHIKEPVTTIHKG